MEILNVTVWNLLGYVFDIFPQVGFEQSLEIGSCVIRDVFTVAPESIFVCQYILLKSAGKSSPFFDTRILFICYTPTLYVLENSKEKLIRRLACMSIIQIVRSNSANIVT